MDVEFKKKKTIDKKNLAHTHQHGKHLRTANLRRVLHSVMNCEKLNMTRAERTTD